MHIPDAAANLGPLVGLEKQQDQYADAVKALSDTALTRLVLVARAQASTLKEVSHTHEELSAIGPAASAPCHQWRAASLCR